jgi:hypothetical protein
MEERRYERDLKLDLFATQGGRGGQGRDLVERTRKLLCGFSQRRSLRRTLSRFAPQPRGFLDLPGLGAVIGKSRLTAALLERLADEPHTRLRYFCSPQRTDSTLYPIIGQMERAAGLAHDDTAQAKLDKLDAVLSQASTSIQDAALFAEMLSLKNDGRYPALALTPQQHRRRTLDALSVQMEALTRSNPVLMVFEDVHWMDPTSLEVLGRVVDRIRTLRVVLIVTFRPEFEPPWIGRPYVTALTINRLAQRDIDALIDQVVGNKPLPASIRQDIIERTDGIPLFVEEMTKAVLEAEGEGEAQRTAALVPSPTLAVPASLHASLMARLDRLGSAKELAQIGAAIGREFSHLLVAAVVREPEAQLGPGLDRLIQAGLLFRQGVPPHATYLFKHALVQDAAYGLLLRASSVASRFDALHTTGLTPLVGRREEFGRRPRPAQWQCRHGFAAMRASRAGRPPRSVPARPVQLARRRPHEPADSQSTRGRRPPYIVRRIRRSGPRSRRRISDRTK